MKRYLVEEDGRHLHEDPRGPWMHHAEVEREIQRLEAELDHARGLLERVGRGERGAGLQEEIEAEVLKR